MSEQNESNVETPETATNVIEEPTIESAAQTPEELANQVAWETHQKLLNQRKADQKKNKTLEQELAALRNEVKNAEQQKLEEKQEYKKLYEAVLEEKKAVETEIAAKEQALVDDHKRRALEKELGGLKNSAYFRFADLSAIVIDDDGMVDLNSVKLEANRYRQQYPELITGANTPKVESRAPGNASALGAPVKASEMSKDERSVSKRELLMKRLKS